MKTNISQTELMKSVRKQWDFNPAPRVVNSKKGYRRKEKFNNKSWEWYVDSSYNLVGGVGWWNFAVNLDWWWFMKPENMKKRYELAHMKVLGGYPAWKRKAVETDIVSKPESSYVKAYVSEVIALAEGNEEIMLTC